MLIETTRPTATAAMRAELSAFLRLPEGFPDTGEQTSRLDRALEAAMRLIEHRTSRALLSRDFELRARRWENCGTVLTLPVSPVAGVGAVDVVDANGAITPIDPALWRLDDAIAPERIVTVPGSAPPSPGEGGHVRVRFTAGSGAELADAPHDLRHAVMRLAATYFDRGDAALAPTADVAALIAPYRRIRL